MPEPREAQKLKTISDLWNEWRSQVMPERVSPVQFTETRRAFYGGCASMLTLVVELAGGEEVSEEEACSRMKALNDEFELFASMIGRGGF